METPTRIKGLGALVAGLPDLVGEHASGSVFVLFETDGALVGVLGWSDAATPSERAQMMLTLAERRDSMSARSGIAVAFRCEPGAVDVMAVAEDIEASLPLHHVLTVSEEHWWASSCRLGCCDGAIHEIPSLLESTRGKLRQIRARAVPGAAEPGAAEPEEVPPSGEVGSAWRAVCGVPARAGLAQRRKHSMHLQVLAGALAHVRTRDQLLVSVAPELFELIGSSPAPAEASWPSMTSAQLRAWFPIVPRHGRAAWKALECAATWREGDLPGARAAAAISLKLGRTALAELLHDITATGLTYERAVAQTRGRGGASFVA